MNAFQKFAATAVAALGFTSFNAAAVTDPNAAVVHLRDPAMGGCVEAGASLNNCFTDIGSLKGWIEGTRKPNATKPLLVEIGPGTFGSYLLCGSGGAVSHISFQGAGMGRSTLGPISIFTNNLICDHLTFSNLTVKGTGPGQYAVVIFSPGGGHTTWHNVELTGPWTEYGAVPCSVRGSHYWFGSRVRGTYQAWCDTSWFIGSELADESGNAAAISARDAEVHFYGSNIRSPYLAVEATNNADVHIHGTGIDVIGGPGDAVVALSAASGAHIHASGVGYVLETGAGGTATRISNNGGHVHAPYLWGHVPDTDGDPTTVDTNFTSANGADQTTVTVGTLDGHPHPAVYSSKCAADTANDPINPNRKWFDTVDRVCRNQ